MEKAICVGVLVVLLFCVASGDLQGDETECASTLQDLTPCIGFLEGMGQQPTSDCCSNVRQVRVSNPRCLCLLIKDISDPSAGLALNQTLIIQMPTLCQVIGKLSDCIDILNLFPSSPDAKIFNMGSAPSPSPSPSTGSSHSKSLPSKPNNNWSYRVQPCLWLSGFVLLTISWFTTFHL
ncbi:hypothetical protein SUGI_0594850 [Cryptomeria japonica]|uniref:non-specific lipid transfer protein GPI-anchored 14-like n=1 Tax=Cryptomeria japonica TaxID=3369 RepID=UPI002414C34E|nr:non-specific lipid transfer protein GPI-anchored 14-like [Cryptomeria japonica]GLJ30081.1 hypothetical protein SUGI_0594850 [Cryptomeria japonica]